MSESPPKPRRRRGTGPHLTPLLRITSRYANEEGVYPGKIFAVHGKLVDVALQDGRDVRCKKAGRLSQARVRLKVGDVVHVKFLLDVDEDSQTPSIVSTGEA